MERRGSGNMKNLGERITMTLRYPLGFKETLELRANALSLSLNELICRDVERANRNFERQNGGEKTNGSSKTDTGDCDLPSAGRSRRKPGRNGGLADAPSALRR